MSRFCPLFSSSKGNALYISAAQDGILIDAGVSAKRIQAALAQLEVNPSSLRGILVTHEHSDHVAGLRVFATRHNIPVYTSQGTLLYLEEHLRANQQGSYDAFCIDKRGMEIGEMFVTPFSTQHDCCESVGYRIELPDGRVLSVATDLGCVTPEILSALRGSDLVFLESNHDVRMLQAGRYPYPLKQRILSDYGHLSNASCAAVLPALLSSGTTRFWLGHLSQENNLPQLAYETSKVALTGEGAILGKDCLLEVASPAGCQLTRF